MDLKTLTQKRLKQVINNETELVFTESEEKAKEALKVFFIFKFLFFFDETPIS